MGCDGGARPEDGPCSFANSRRNRTTGREGAEQLSRPDASRTTMKPPYALISSLLLAAIASAPAHAGGLGIVATGGMHTDRAYYYNAEGEQGIDNQTLPQAGIGIEGLLGDRDDKILGM